jgi:hypothetical protein
MASPTTASPTRTNALRRWCCRADASAPTKATAEPSCAQSCFRIGHRLGTSPRSGSAVCRHQARQLLETDAEQYAPTGSPRTQGSTRG